MTESKRQTYTLMAIDKKVIKGEIRLDHPDQRASDQWNAEGRDNLISDAIQGNPINPLIICQQYLTKLPTYWAVDGKQRLTYLLGFRRGTFKLGKKIERYEIEYIHTEMQDGEPVQTVCSCDIRGKSYQDLPEELREKFDLYEVEAVIYLGCTDEDVDYTIRRYNRGKSLTAAQKGTMYIGTKLAKVVKRLGRHEFFQDRIGKYTDSDLKNGSIDRVIAETVMASNYLNDWHKSLSDTCDYLRVHAEKEQFDELEENLDRLSEVMTDEIRPLFNNRDTFLFVALFKKFQKAGMADNEYANFLADFKSRNIDVEKSEYKDLCEKATKDKAIVLAKMNFLIQEMDNYVAALSGAVA